MTLVTLRALTTVLTVGVASAAVAAGGGGSAGGSGAQNAINSGRTLADGQPGPLGSSNNPRPHANPASTTGQAVAPDTPSRVETH